MTEISEAAATRWKELVAAAGHDPHRAAVTLVQQVSDAAKAAKGVNAPHLKQAYFAPFILPEPRDLLVDILSDVYGYPSPRRVQKLREVLAKRGLQITETSRG